MGGCGGPAHQSTQALGGRIGRGLDCASDLGRCRASRRWCVVPRRLAPRARANAESHSRAPQVPWLKSIPSSKSKKKKKSTKKKKADKAEVKGGADKKKQDKKKSKGGSKR